MGRAAVRPSRPAARFFRYQTTGNLSSETLPFNLNQFMRCIGRIKDLRRCKNEAAHFFCRKHRWQPLFAAISLLTFIGTATGVFRDVIDPVFAYFSNSSRQIELNKNYPIKFGEGRKEVQRHLGKPQDEGVVFQSYYSEGLRVYYDRHTQQVDGFVVSPQDSGVAFKGLVLGLRVGDLFERAKTLYGNPLYWGQPNPDISLALWHVDGKLLMVSLSRTERDSGRITSMVICMESSFASYDAVATVVAGELHRGLKPSFLEPEALTEDTNVIMAFDNPVFSEPFAVIGTDLCEYGGASTYVMFGESNLVTFWLYPAGDNDEPRIRAIYRPDQIQH